RTAPTRIASSPRCRPRPARNVPATRTSRLTPRFPQSSVRSPRESVLSRSGTGVTPHFRSFPMRFLRWHYPDQVLGSGRLPTLSRASRLPGRTGASLPGENRLDAVGGARERLVVEEVRDGVLDLMRGPVERVGAACSVQCVADRDLVRDHEHGVVWEREELAEGPRVAKRGVIEAFTTRERDLAGMGVFPRAVGLELLALEVAHVDVVEERLVCQRHVAPCE